MAAWDGPSDFRTSSQRGCLDKRYQDNCVGRKIDGPALTARREMFEENIMEIARHSIAETSQGLPGYLRLL